MARVDAADRRARTAHRRGALANNAHVRSSQMTVITRQSGHL